MHLDIQNTAIEFIGAFEAATGEEQTGAFSNPMTPDAILSAYHHILTAPRPDRGLDVLERTGILKETLPEVADMVGFGDAVRHKDVWAHTKQVICQTPNRLVVRWAALLHDIGKVSTRKFTKDGQVTFIGHPEVGARMFKKITMRLPFSKENADGIRFLIAAHLRASGYQETWTDSAVRRFTTDTGPYLEDLLDLCRADITSKYEEKVRRGLRQINLLAARVMQILEQDAKPKALPTGLGKRLIQQFQVPADRRLGALMEKLAAAVDENRLPADADYQVYINYVKSHPELL